MTRATFVLVPLVAVAGALLGALLPVPAAILLAVTVAGGAAWGLWVRKRRRVERVAGAINRWLSQQHHDPIVLEGGQHWRHLATAVNTLGSSHDRRGEQLRTAQQWRTRLVESLVFPALLFSHEGHLVVANAATRELLDLHDDEHVTVAQALGSAALVGAVREALDSGTHVQLDAELGERQVRAAVSPLDGGALVVLIDLTEQRRVEDMRRNFVANASHELKTPVAGIQALTDALEVSLDDPGRAREVVGRLREEAQGLASLVHDLLNLRRLEEGERAATAPVDLVEVIQEEAGLLQPAAEAAEVTVAADLPGQAVVAGVEEDLRLVVKNLLANAIQYNVAGGRVDVCLQRGEEGYEVTLHDTGIGIAQQDLPRIFERFYRVDVARSREAGGTGLGLSLVRHAVERHGGRVEVDSLLGEGSTFRVTLPVQQA